MLVKRTEVAPSNYDLTFEGDLTLTDNVRTLTWTKGEGTITFSGGSDTTLTVPSGWTEALGKCWKTSYSTKTRAHELTREQRLHGIVHRHAGAH